MQSERQKHASDENQQKDSIRCEKSLDSEVSDWNFINCAVRITDDTNHTKMGTPVLRAAVVWAPNEQRVVPHAFSFQQSDKPKHMGNDELYQREILIT